MARHDDSIPFWRRLAGTFAAMLAVLGVLAVVIVVLGALAARRASALLELSTTEPSTSPATRAAPATLPAGTVATSTLSSVSAVGAPGGQPPAGVVRIAAAEPDRPKTPDRIAAPREPQRPLIVDPPRPPVDAVKVDPAKVQQARIEQAKVDQLKVETITLDSPRGEFTLPTVTFGRSVVIRGRIKTLMLTAVTAGASVDAMELDVQDIKVRGAIDGGSTVRLRATEKVKFSAPIDGRSKVEISVPNGKADFATDPSIEGGSRVTIAARHIEFHGMIAGERTDVAATISNGGSIRFVKMDGTSRVRYGKANPTDAIPEIKKGKILGRAQFGTFDEVE